MNKKYLQYAGIAFVVILLVVGIYYRQTRSEVVNSINPGLTQEEKRIYEEKIKVVDSELKVATDADDRKALYMLKGSQLQGLGEYRKAKSAYEEAVKAAPDESAPRVSMFGVLVAMNDNVAAKAAIEKALELSPKDPDTWQRYLIFMEERMNVTGSELKDLYQKALSQTDTNQTIAVNYARFLERQGSVNEAVQMWEFLVNRDPGEDVLKQELERVKSLDLQNQ